VYGSFSKPGNTGIISQTRSSHVLVLLSSRKFLRYKTTDKCDNQTPELPSFLASDIFRRYEAKIPSVKVLASAMSNSIDEYFARYPDFDFRPSLTDWRQIGQFNALAQTLGWSQERRRSEWEEFKRFWIDVVENEFEHSDLEHYQGLCQDLSIDPVPASITACKAALRNVYVNIVDLVQYRIDRRARRRATRPIRFDSLEELSVYTEETKKWYPRETAKAEMLRELLKILT
jgi:hypothetical protein